MQEENQWIREVLAGDKQAYAQIIDKYKNLLYGTILRMTKNPHDAQDLVQEAFIKIYQQLGKYDGTGSFSSWMYRVAMNHCMDEFRMKRYQMKQIEIDEERMISPDHPEIIFLKREKSRQLERLIATLPDDFTLLVLDQLEPYAQKNKRRKPWKRILLTAAGMVLAVGLSATVNPSFAAWIGGMFSTDQVDEGLRIATDAGLVDRVNLEILDNGITFKVEDVIADSSRVALSYQVLNKNGKPQDTYFDLADSKNKLTAVDQNGKEFDNFGTGWTEGSDYGLIEFSLREQESLEVITVKFDLVELNGVKGNWHLEVPIDLSKVRKLTTSISLNDAQISKHGVTVNMKEIQFAPSSSELLYETGFTKSEEARVENEIKKLETQLGKESVRSETDRFETAAQYHIENEDKETIYKHDYNTLFTEEQESDDLLRYQSTGHNMEQLGQVAWNESFIPQKEDAKLTFVLDGVFKTVPSDFSVTFNPKELRRNPVSFEYEGNFITIKKAGKEGEFYLRKSILPIGRDKFYSIELEGGIEANASRLGTWVVMDDKGNSYPVYGGVSTLKKQDENGRHKTNNNLRVYGLDEVPEELTLHLISVTRYEEVEDKWEVSLYEVQSQ